MDDEYGFDNSDVESRSGSSSSSSYVSGGDYSDEEIEKKLFGDVSDIEYSDDDEYLIETAPKEKCYKRKINELEIQPNNIPDLKMLDELETKYLPIGYISSLKSEWLYLEEACLSNFKNVHNLARVSNKTISHIANVAQYALQQKTASLKDLNKAFINYAFQRNV